MKNRAAHKVYLLRMDRDLSQAEYRELLPLISAEKRGRIGRFPRFIDKQRALFGELLVRAEISQALSLPESGVKIMTTERGKPYLAGFPDFHFNISHTGRFVACAFSDAPVGIDIETIRPSDMRIAERFFADKEREYILEQPSGPARLEAFYRVWTMKEAYIKREGSGLGTPLPSFDVFGVEGVRFSELLRSGEAICYCCSERSEGPRITWFDVDEITNADPHQ
ncbi:MAG: 4'-phosphopantetheinyl transferase superfamily protein [Oscillospiraceae bacterium]|nr:4'-phosphopantetheinyl transferase superfamily protein [Oscillospiraceae bacterium]